MSVSAKRVKGSEEAPRMLTREEVEAIVRRVRGFARGGGNTVVSIGSWWTGEVRWGRNRVSLASDRRSVSVTVERRRGNFGGGGANTNQIDDESLEAVVRAAERSGRMMGDAERREDLHLPPPPFEYPEPAIWSDATFDLATEARSAVVREVMATAETADMLSAGYLEMRGQGTGLAMPDRDLLYATCTQARCSLTVRDRRGSGSGWAGLSGYDWSKIDPSALAKRALEKALASRNPVALEPGRYTVILEPQAVHDLIEWIFDPPPMDRATTEQGRGPFFLGRDPGLGIGRSKLGLKVMDERITVDHDPTDPALGVIPFGFKGEPIRPVKWIDRGVLVNLTTDRTYALSKLNENLGYPDAGSFRMSGGETTIEEMIKTTKRGLLVTRFSNLSRLDFNSVLMTGLTRDGLWLIENGAITKAVKNFRFTESPLFVLNSIEQLGVPVPVFRPAQRGVTPAIVPPLKARDFSFTSTIDAI
jgi:predicted Zn-dependent protease